MVSKILRADGVTELASIKSVTYHESVNADTDLRPGCVASSYIEVTCFGAQSDAPDVGEALTYYQVVGETETLIGIFYAEPSIPTKNSYSFIAYDAVHKLDADFSTWLSANQEDFPYTVYQLVSQACTISGVTLGTSSWANSTMQVNAWYADSITCRNILQYAAEIACKFVRCNTSGEIIFDWYKAVNENILDGITFTDGKYYNDSGNLSNSGSTRYEDAFIQVDPRNTYTFEFGSTSTNRFRLHEYTESQSWIEQIISSPVSNTSITYTPSENARYVRMSYPIACNTISMSLPVSRIYPTTGTFNGEECYAYKQDGLTYDNYDTSALARVAVHPVGEDDVAYYYPTDVTSGNTLDITNNALLYGASAADMTSIAQTVYDGITAVGQYRPMDVSMFPNECPFRSGQIVPVTDAQGVSFTTAIMSKVVTDSSVTLTSTGREVYGDYALDTAKKLIQLAADIVQINKLKVDWAEIDQIFARDITVTGQLHSEDYSYTDGEIYANQGMGMDFGAKRYNTPNFGITPDGNVYAQGGKIAGFNIHNSIYEEEFPPSPTSYTVDSYTYVDGLLTVVGTGTVSFNQLPVSKTIDGTTYPLTKIYYQPFNSSGSGNSSIATTYIMPGQTVSITRAVQYLVTGSEDKYTIIPLQTLLPQSTVISLRVNLTDGSSCRIILQYGSYFSLYTEHPDIGTDDGNIYLGDDGISVGENIIMTPDGNAKFWTVEVGNPRTLRTSLGIGTNGELPITVAQGGSGQTDATSTNTVSDIATPGASNTTIVSAGYAQWGKVAMVHLVFERTVNTGINTDVLLARLASDKLPKTISMGIVRYTGANAVGYIDSSGNVRLNTPVSIPLGTQIVMDATYVLA